MATLTKWALSLRRAQASLLASLHDVPGVVVAESNELVWARGESSAAETDRILTRLPSSRFFTLVHGNRLRPKGRWLPTGRLPELRWAPLRQWLSVRLPNAALPGELAGGAELELVRARGPDGGEELLLCSIDAFRRCVLHDPKHRLERLRFVVNEARAEILVRGSPLPSLPGERFVLRHGIAVPAGFAWSPPVGTSVVRAWLGLGDGAMALWRADGSISEIAHDWFVVASRRAGRMP